MRHVFVTGASRGMGLEFVRQCLQRGDIVFAGCRQPERAHLLDALASERLHRVQLDVTDQASIEAAAAAVRGQTDKLDLLINNAGILLDDEKIPDNLAALDFERVGQVFATNAVGAVMVARALLDMLRRARHAQVINITSVYGSIELHTHTDTYAYSASKAALNMFTRILAHDKLTRGMTVITLDPGWVRTDMGGQSADLSVEEAVGGMMRVIDSLTPKDTGTFRRWDGAVMPW
jgi:NAD(P)-dependent dehydrogenase (short-subunit alcohol dehydrogenase family)